METQNKAEDAALAISAVDFQDLAVEYARLRRSVVAMVESRRQNAAKVQIMLDAFGEMVEQFQTIDPETNMPWYLKDHDPLAIKLIHSVQALHVMLEHWMAEVEMVCSINEWEVASN